MSTQNRQSQKIPIFKFYSDTPRPSNSHLSNMVKRVARKAGKARKARVAKKATKKKKSVKKTKMAKPKKELRAVQPKGKHLNQAELVNNMCVETGLGKKQMREAFAAMARIGSHELKKGRKFIVPGVARFVVKQKAARKARMGRNPFTGEEMMFKAKPASRFVRAYAVKVFKTL